MLLPPEWRGPREAGPGATSIGSMRAVLQSIPGITGDCLPLLWRRIRRGAPRAQACGSRRAGKRHLGRATWTSTPRVQRETSDGAQAEAADAGDDLLLSVRGLRGGRGTPRGAERRVSQKAALGTCRGATDGRRSRRAVADFMGPTAGRTPVPHPTSEVRWLQCQVSSHCSGAHVSRRASVAAPWTVQAHSLHRVSDGTED